MANCLKKLLYNPVIQYHEIFKRKYFMYILCKAVPIVWKKKKQGAEQYIQNDRTIV